MSIAIRQDGTRYCTRCQFTWPSSAGIEVTNHDCLAIRLDLIDHPPHYTAHPSGVECITITEHMNFCVGNAVKYLWRAGQKGPALEDLKKARWYIDREIARLEGKHDGP